jgi:hypothetical protein
VCTGCSFFLFLLLFPGTLNLTLTHFSLWMVRQADSCERGQSSLSCPTATVLSTLVWCS